MCVWVCQSRIHLGCSYFLTGRQAHCGTVIQSAVSLYLFKLVQTCQGYCEAQWHLTLLGEVTGRMTCLNIWDFSSQHGATKRNWDLVTEMCLCLHWCFKKKPSSCIALLHRSHVTTRAHVQKMCRRQPAERRSIEAHTKNKNQGKTFTVPIGRSSTIPIWLAKQIFDPYLPAANMSGKFLIWSMRNWKVNTLVIWHC